MDMPSSFKNPVNIFEYDDYRKFLKDFYQAKKNEDPSFSYRAFAEAGGFRAPNTLKRVMEGDRNLALKGIEQFSKALKLKKEEAKFFKNLVFFTQAQNPDKKDLFAQELLKSKLLRKQKPLAKNQYEFWSNWFYSIIRELVQNKNFKEDPQWIAQNIIPSISPKEVNDALKKLLDLNLLKRNNDGKLEQTDGNITSGDPLIKTSLRKFHRQMIQKGKEAIDRFSQKERYLSSITLWLSPEKIIKLIQMYETFIKEMLILAQEESEQNQIFQANFQLFPFTPLFKDESSFEKE